MTLTKPKISKVYVQATDPDTNKSRSLTIYGVTPEQAIDLIAGQVSPETRPTHSDSRSPRRRPRQSAD